MTLEQHYPVFISLKIKVIKFEFREFLPALILNYLWRKCVSVDTTQHQTNITNPMSMSQLRCFENELFVQKNLEMSFPSDKRNDLNVISIITLQLLFAANLEDCT